MGRMRSYQIGNHDPLQFNYNERGLETARGVEGGFYQTQRYSAVGELAEQRVFAGRGARESAQALLRGEQGQQSLLNAQGLKPDQPIAALVAGRDYEYDATGAPKIIADLLHGRTTYTTDANGQVKQAEHKQANQTITENFQYHPTLDVKGSSVSTATPIGKVLDQSQETWGRRKGGAINQRDGLNWTYDQAGRVIEKVITRNGFRPETHKFEWNGSDQLVGFKKIVNHEIIEAWEYEYDAFSRRVSKTCTHRKATHEANDNQHNDNAPNGYRPQTGKSRPQVKRVKFLWDRHSLVAEQKVYADGTTAQVVWHYDPGQLFSPSAREEAGQVSYAVKDHLGTPRELISEGGQVQWTRAHLLWGEDAPRFAKEPAAENDNHLMPFRFQGQQFDEETGLSYNRYRYYDDHLSGYLVSDPKKLAGGARAHSYPGNPTFLFDPLALNPLAGAMSSTMPGTGCWAAHHIIPQKVWNDNSTFFDQLPNDLHDPSNGKWMPTDQNRPDPVSGKTLPAHRGCHKLYSEEMERRVEKIIEDHMVDGVVTDPAAASAAISDLQNAASAGLENGMFPTGPSPSVAGCNILR